MNAQISQHLKTNRPLPALSPSEALPSEGGIELHAIEDLASIQRALSVVINAVAAGTLDPARAKVLLYGLQIASANARRVAPTPKEEKIVPAIETAGGEHTLSAPATSAPEMQESQPLCAD